MQKRLSRGHKKNSVPLHPLDTTRPACYNPAMLVALTGFRGAGKTTVGSVLAGKLGLDFIDMDSEIERREKETVASIFENRGEAAFRHMETGLAAELSERDNLVVATGGGVVTSEEARETLLNKAVVVYLEADAETLHTRIAADEKTPHTRPVLAEGVDERKPLYESTCSFAVDTSNMTPGQTAARIMEMLKDYR